MSYTTTRNDEMFMSDWYDNYLIKYVNIISKLKFSDEQQEKYNQLLVEWYGNWNGYEVEIDEG
jgi:hypothetical protein